ncbi:MAG: winged helix-turn-helix transcriptional regulator [Candidatus Altiarchaeota archaeon]
MKLDALDRELLKHLQTNARLSLRELGRMLNMPHTTVFTRVNRLVNRGIIKKFSAILHPHEIGLKLNFLLIDVPESESKDLAAKIAECSEVMKVFRTDKGGLIVKAISQDNGPTCLSNIMSKLEGYDVTVYPIDEVVKYDHKIHDDFINQMG